MQNEIDNTLRALKKCDCILYPTDTIWGIGCDATKEKSIKNIYKIKGRNTDKSLIILVSDNTMLMNYIEELHIIAIDLINSTQKPLTIIYPKAKELPSSVVAEDGSIAIRVVRDEFCKELITKFGKPIISTSANISGESTPLSFQSISEKVKSGVDYIVKHKQEYPFQIKSSTIIKLNENGIFNIVRK